MTHKNILCEEIKKDVTKVVIKNWPKTNYFSVYIPMLIAIIALSISLYSNYLTRKIFVESHRPYVWAINYAVTDHDENTIIQVPSSVMFCVTNSPARIIRVEVKINLNMETLLFRKKEDLVRFPHEETEWRLDLNKKDFDKIMDRPNEDKSKLVRLISLEYSSLDGGKIYHHNLKQSFFPIANQWGTIEENAD